MLTFNPKGSVKFVSKFVLKITLIFTVMIFVSACGSQTTNYQSKITANTAKKVSTANYYNDSELINLSNCTNGLNGMLATQNAGNTFKTGGKANGKIGGKKSVVQVESAFTALDRDPAPSNTQKIKSRNGFTNKLLVTAYSQTGRPYNPNGSNPQSGFSPTNFTQWVYAQQGIKISTNNLKQVTDGLAIKKDDLRPGDILVYQDSQNKSSYHLGIYTGQGNFLHASQKGKVVYETAAFGPEYGPYFIGGRRYFDDPAAKALPENQKLTVTNNAIKLALSELGSKGKVERYSQTPKSKKK